jgi:type II secretory pathway pseudopilin PulG
MKNTSGNVIFIVLIAIALFGALAMTLTKSLSGVSESRITKQQAKAASAAIIKYGSDLQQALSRMQLVNNCSDEEISFERSPFDGSDTDYVNANAPGDFSCHLFHPNGGAAPYQAPQRKWQDESQSAQANFNTQVFNTACVNDIGLSSPGSFNCNADSNDSEFTELILFTPFLNIEVCKAINNEIANTTTIPQDATSLWTDGYKFKGTFPVAAIAVGPGGWQGRMNYCIEGDVNPAAGTYNYYHVLLPR